MDFISSYWNKRVLLSSKHLCARTKCCPVLRPLYLLTYLIHWFNYLVSISRTVSLQSRCHSVWRWRCAVCHCFSQFFIVFLHFSLFFAVFYCILLRFCATDDEACTTTDGFCPNNDGFCTKMRRSSTHRNCGWALIMRKGGSWRTSSRHPVAMVARAARLRLWPRWITLCCTSESAAQIQQDTRVYGVFSQKCERSARTEGHQVARYNEINEVRPGFYCWGMVLL